MNKYVAFGDLASESITGGKNPNMYLVIVLSNQGTNHR